MDKKYEMVNLEECNLAEKILHARDWSEGSIGLQRLLIKLYINGISTGMCCSGIKDYPRHTEENHVTTPNLQIIIAPENAEFVKQLVSQISKKDFKSIHISVSKGTLYIGTKKQMSRDGISTEEADAHFDNITDIVERTLTAQREPDKKPEPGNMKKLFHDFIDADLDGSVPKTWKDKQLESFYALRYDGEETSILHETRGKPLSILPIESTNIDDLLNQINTHHLTHITGPNCLNSQREL